MKTNHVIVIVIAKTGRSESESGTRATLRRVRACTHFRTTSGRLLCRIVTVELSPVVCAVVAVGVCAGVAFSRSHTDPILARPPSPVASLPQTSVMGTPDHYLSLLTRGGVFLKHGRAGSPHPRCVHRCSTSLPGPSVTAMLSRLCLCAVCARFTDFRRFVWVSMDYSTIAWRQVGSQSVKGSIPTSSLRRVAPGASSAVFKRGKGRPGRDNACFTLFCDMRTLDLEVELLGNTLSAGVLPEVCLCSACVLHPPYGCWLEWFASSVAGSCRRSKRVTSGWKPSVR